MVKKRLAMGMVTIFVALIVCGMFFPDLARGADLSSDQGLQVKFPEVVVGEQETMSVGITNETDHNLKIWLALNKDAGCPPEYFEYTGPNIYPDVPGVLYEPGDTLTVQVTFKPLAVGVCTAFLQITPMVTNDEGVTIYFTAEGVPESADNFGPIVMGGLTTSVMDRPIPIDEHTTYTLSEMIDECMDKFNIPGQVTRYIAWTTGELYSEGLITRQEKNELRMTAAKLEWQRIFQRMKKRRSSKGSTKLRRFWWCRDN